MPASRCSSKGKALKKAGMSRAAEKHSEELEIARAYAWKMAHFQERITIEEVRQLYEEQMDKPWNLGNAAGSVFKGPEWEMVGYTEAKRPEAHARILRVWRLKR
jgi:hypothetical protein